MLIDLNPSWKSYANELAETGSEPRTNPDGDVELRGRTFEDFIVPKCEHCLASGKDAKTASIVRLESFSSSKPQVYP